MLDEKNKPPREAAVMRAAMRKESTKTSKRSRLIGRWVERDLVNWFFTFPVAYNVSNY